ncbi:MAG: hypothetical protein VB934_03215 [Polyangiaceae bacterium]
MKKWNLLVPVLFVVAPACIIVDDTEPAADPYEAESAFCEDLATAACSADVVMACFMSTEEQVSDDTRKCVSNFLGNEGCNPLGLAYRKEGAAECIAAVKQAYADGKLTLDEVMDEQDACLAVYSIGGEVGTSCEADVDCDGAAALRCVLKKAVGTCQEPEQVDPGHSCAAANAVCEEGFYCGSDDACIQRPGPAEACASDKPCVETARCVDDLCVPKTGNGEGCAAAEECEGGFCVMAAGQMMGTCGSQVILSPTTADSCERFLP